MLEGEGLMEIGNETHVVRKHDVIYLPPDMEHSISNTGSWISCSLSQPRRLATRSRASQLEAGARPTPEA